MPCFQGVSINGSPRLLRAAAQRCSCVPVPGKSRVRCWDSKASVATPISSPPTWRHCPSLLLLPRQAPTWAVHTCCYPTLHLQQHPEVGMPPWGLSWSLCSSTQGRTRYGVMLNWPHCCPVLFPCLLQDGINILMGTMVTMGTPSVLRGQGSPTAPRSPLEM